DDLGVAEALAAQVRGERLPPAGGVADAEPLGVGPGEAPLGEESPGVPGPRGEQLPGVELLGDPVRLDQPLPLPLVRPLGVAALLVAEPDPGLDDQRLHRLDEADVL